MALSSTKNSFLQGVRRAAADGRITEAGLIVAEGPHLLDEASQGCWKIEQVLATPRARERHARLLGNLDAELVEVSERAFSSIAATENPQEILALVRPRRWAWEELMNDPALVVIMDGIQDPGNAGTIVRSAEAFGATGVVLMQSCAHVANGKFLRATAGSIFRLPFQEGIALRDLLIALRGAGLRLCALVSGRSTPVQDVDLRAPCGLIVGSEGSGISPALLAAAEPVSIWTRRVDSLNAAVACSIALFEAHRQRNAK